MLVKLEGFDHIMTDGIVPNLVGQQIPHSVQPGPSKNVTELLVIKGTGLLGNSAGKKLSYCIGGMKMNPTVLHSPGRFPKERYC